MTTHTHSKNPGEKPPATEVPDVRGEAGLARDIRLACHATDKNDNDFVIGLIGKRLNPLSKLVERMRKTTQTSLYMETMGPFFTGKALWQSEQPK